MSMARAIDKIRIAELFLLFACLFTRCYAQKESIVISPGDSIHVKVLEAPELEQTGRVNDEGVLPLIIGGDVKLAGLTPIEAASTIRQALERGHYILNPHVVVNIEQTATLNVTVLGAVKAPGSYSINTPRSILDVLSLAGGLAPDASRKVTIERHDTKELIDYVVSNRSQVALKNDVMVFPGDKVIVPKAGIIYILGDVGRPGGIEMATNDSKLSALQAVAMAGGTRPSAVPSHTVLVRKQADGTYVETRLNVSAMQKGKMPDMQLQADDIVYIPFSYLRNIVLGAGSLLAAAASAAVYRF